MADVVQFAPRQANPPFRFQPTLGGVVYLAVVTWNLFGQRWYLSLYQLAGPRVLTVPMVASPDDYDVDLVKGYGLGGTIVFRESSRSFEVT